MNEIHFAGVVQKGRLELDDPASFYGALSALNCKPVYGVLKEKKPNRSSQQNKAWWGIMVPLFAEAYGEDNHEAAHYVLVRQVHFEMTEDAKGRKHRKCKPTHNLDRAEFSALWERAARFMAEEYGIVVPDPDPAMARI